MDEKHSLAFNGGTINDSSLSSAQTSNNYYQMSGTAPVTTLTTVSMFNATLKPEPNFDVKDDVNVLCNAFTNGPNKDAIIGVLCHRTSNQRDEIFTAYYAQTGRYLIQDIKTNFNFNLYLLFAGLSVPYYEYLARCIHRGGSMIWLYYILFTIPNEEIINMKDYFLAKYQRNVETFITETIRHYNKNAERYYAKPLMYSLEARRIESISVSPTEVNYDVDRLVNLKPSMFSSNKNEKAILKDVFYYKNWSHVRAVCEEYNRKNEKSIFDVVDKCQWTVRDDILSNIAKYALNKDYYFAFVLKFSMKGLGTNDLLLIHTIIKRSEIDLADIKEEFQSLYKKSLREWVRDDTSGHYKNGLYALMDEHDFS